MFQGGWTVQKFKLSIPIRSLLGMYKPPHFWFFKGTWVDQAGVNFHRDGKTHTPGKAAKILLFSESTIFIWQQPRHCEEITPQGRHPGAGDRATGSRSSSVPPRLVRKGARGQEGPFRRGRSQDTAFHPVSWEEEKKELWVGTHTLGLRGRRWAAFVKGWTKPRQLCDGRKLSPAAAQNKKELFLQEVFLVNLLSDTVVSTVLMGLLSTAAAYKEARVRYFRWADAPESSQGHAFIGRRASWKWVSLSKISPSPAAMLWQPGGRAQPASGAGSQEEADGGSGRQWGGGGLR